MGINAPATCSDSSRFAKVKACKQAKKRPTRYQRRVNEKEPGSKNRAKAIKKLAIFQVIADIRADTLHKLTTRFAKNHSTIAIEDLNVSGMLKNHKLDPPLLGVGCGCYEFKRQLIYKGEWYGSTLVIADRFYPSSQICSHCGQKQKMPLHKRTDECGNCGLKADRDFNAAVNLENYVIA